MKLVIRNYLEDELYDEIYDPELKSYVKIRKIKPYDEEKWKNGSVYEFDTLKEMCEFINSCDIDFTEEYEEINSGKWDEEVIDVEYYIDLSEDNLMVMLISFNPAIMG